MASAAAPGTRPVEGTRFFTIMAFVMSAIIIAGFSLNLAMGRSSFSLPLAYHVHGMIFMGWIALFLVQHLTIAKGNRALHASIGKLAYVWVPAMVVAGCTIIVVSAQRTGGPFFFAQNEFFVSNTMALLTFGGLALWALRQRRYTGWTRSMLRLSAIIPMIGKMKVTHTVMVHALGIINGSGSKRPNPGPVSMLIATSISRRCHPV